MKIKRIGYENFRTFKERGDICFSTDGKVNIIYGGNGAGKTTLHQLFQWIFYSTTSFNKSSSDKLYNLEYEYEQSIDSTFSVIGEIEFEHEEKLYIMRREWLYQKKLSSSKNINKKITLSCKTEDYGWERVPGDIGAFVEQILPSGLSAYFFFDGERMITDLMEKGQDSSKKLKKALYSIFNLNLYEKASRHIGSSDIKTSVIGKLYLSKTGKGNQPDISALKVNIENAIEHKEETEANIETRKTARSTNLQDIKEISETIGGAKTGKEYNNLRKTLRDAANSIVMQIDKELQTFGEKLVLHYPKILVSQSVMFAKKVLKHKLDAETLIPGIERPLINAILSGDGTCICGQLLDEDAKKRLSHYLDLLPPVSYKRVYDIFTHEAKALTTATRYDLSIHIRNVLDLKRQQHDIEEKIRIIDEELKSIVDDGILVNKRSALENENINIDDELNRFSDKLTRQKLHLTKLKKEFEAIVENNSSNAAIQQKIEIMQSVKRHFDEDLVDLAREYSRKLCTTIKTLLEKMLTTKRNVEMSEDFLLRVFDNFGDEYKSEGQFAVVTFAYIGGIFQMINEDLNMPQKEFPLVLDGPFSKLDPINRQSVINSIPDYAPQIILFSKDDLNPLFHTSKLGKIYNISSNEYSNVSKVEEVHICE
ncbi:MAG: AAA family ATPase [Oscillospiraceae bacterium]|nr:AAA family ATPase [Oscillospiraceae bacterium]